MVLLFEGLLAAGLVLAAIGWGAWPAVGLGLGRRNAGQQLCVAAALGLGILSTLTLALGVVGGLNRVLAWSVLVIGWVLGLTRAYVFQRRTLQPGSSARRAGERDGAPSANGRYLIATTLLLLTLLVPIAIVLFGASLPPRVLWSGENFAYDVLEYHLQGPREYFDAGRIEFLPHNVYASFPQQMEMLYLLLMHLAGGPLAGAIPAQLLHALCGLLAVAALAAWSPPGWPRTIVAILAGSVPWLACLGCLAYVELGMLLFAAVAAGLVLDHFHASVAADPRAGRSTGWKPVPHTGKMPVPHTGWMPVPHNVAAGAPTIRASHSDWRITVAAGVCAGLAGGCKYTALAFVAAALLSAWLVTMSGSLKLRARRLALYAGGAIVAFSPWLIRNAAFTGNPVYPFAYRCFGGSAWSAEQAEQWARGHRVAEENASCTGRLQIINDELLKSWKIGPALLLLAVAGLVRGRSRPAAMPAIWLALIVAGWAALTHMPGRFVIPAVVPLTMLAGLALARQPSAARRPARAVIALLACAAAAGAVMNDLTLAGLLRDDDRHWRRYGYPLRKLLGQVEFVQQAELVNELVPPDGKVWLIGEARAFYLTPRVHYTVVFNRDPWLEYARAAAPDEAVAWLRTQNVTHVVFSWREIGRLRKSYGFPEFVTRAWVALRTEHGLRRVEVPPAAQEMGIEVYEVVP